MRESLESIESLAYRRLRAPAEHGGVLAIPPLGRVVASLQAIANPSIPKPSQSSGAASASPLLAQVRSEVGCLALRYTSEYRDYSPVHQADFAASTWLVTGHQPRLFHPGVWIKNFALSTMARQAGAVPLNLIVDNDLCSEHGLNVPIDEGEWRQTSVSWDERREPQPFEDHYVADADQFRAFAERAAPLAKQFADAPILNEIWPMAVDQQRRGRPLGQCMAIARHAFEGRHGLQTLEAPLGQVFDLPSVRRWTAEVLRRLPSLHAIYNDVLRVFRANHRIRSRSHPVPNLGLIGPWREAPFWVWAKDDPHRRPLFVRETQGAYEFGNQAGWQSGPGDLASLLERLAPTHRIRPRALITTLFARTALGDTFIHGIGGAKYDQVTDAIIIKFMEIEPPDYLTLTATVRLQDRPIQSRREQIRTLRQRLRELTFNPQRRLVAEPAADELIGEKTGLLRQKTGLAERHRRLREINEQLQPFVATERAQTQAALDEAKRMLREDLILGSREQSICWFDAQELPLKLLDLCEKAQ